jgi:hypothetical protein
MDWTDRRKRFRAVLSGKKCHALANARHDTRRIQDWLLQRPSASRCFRSSFADDDGPHLKAAPHGSQ